MSSSEPDRDAAEAERKSTLAESLIDGVADLAVEISAKVVVETMATAISNAADVAASAGEVIIECSSAVVEGIVDQL